MLLEKYELTITLIEPMLGTVPKSPEVYAAYIAEKTARLRKNLHTEGVEPVVEAVTEDEAAQMIAEEVETVTLNEEKGWTGFHEDSNGVFLYDYQIKGFLKEAGNILKDQLKVAALKSKLDNTVFVFPRRIHIGVQPSDVLERPLRAMTMQGPRVTLVRSDMIPEGTTFKCELRVLPNKEVKEETIRSILEYGALKGLGQFRNGSYGRFDFELKKVE